MMSRLIDTIAEWAWAGVIVLAVMVGAIVMVNCLGCIVTHGGDGELGMRWGTEVVFFNRTISDDTAYIEVASQPLSEWIEKNETPERSE